jgi:hypothetical protein
MKNECIIVFLHVPQVILQSPQHLLRGKKKRDRALKTCSISRAHFLLDARIEHARCYARATCSPTLTDTN